MYVSVCMLSKERHGQRKESLAYLSERRRRQSHLLGFHCVTWTFSETPQTGKRTKAHQTGQHYECYELFRPPR